MEQKIISNSIEACNIILKKIEPVRNKYPETIFAIGNYRSLAPNTKNMVIVSREGSGIEDEDDDSADIDIKIKAVFDNGKEKIVRAKQDLTFRENYSINVIGEDYEEVARLKEEVYKLIIVLRNDFFIEDEPIEEEVSHENNGGKNLSRHEINLSLPVNRQKITTGKQINDFYKIEKTNYSLIKKKK